MPATRRLGAALLVLGIGAAWLAQLTGSSATAPLFDGILVEDPYRYVEPPSGGTGDPLPAEVNEPVASGSVPLIALATSEVPPQGQIIAEADAFDIPVGATSVTVSIQPSAPSDKQVAGNLYRFSVTDQAGTELAVRPGALVTIVLRAPTAGLGLQVGRLGDAGWTLMPTDHGGLPDLFAANITELGTYAVLMTSAPSGSSAAPSATGPAGSPGPSGGGNPPAGNTGPPWVVIILGAAAVGLGLLWGLIGGDDR